MHGQQSDFYRDILQNLSDGAMAVDFEGRIILFNPAAEGVFGLTEEQVVDRKFAEVFMFEIEGSDDFNQVVLDAVGGKNLDVDRVVRVRGKEGESLVLKVKSSLLQGDAGEKKGVVVVFTDITTEKKMEEEQKRLNQDLQQAYTDLENTNSSLRSTLKKIRMVRVIIVLLAVVLFSGLGVYVWKQTDISGILQSSPKAERSGEREHRTVSVQVRPVDSNISLSGKLAPLEKVNVLCPYGGRVEKKFVQFGQRVQKGDPLVVLASEDLEQKLRDANTNLIETREKYHKLKKWEESTEYARAQRKMSEAKHKLQRTKSKLKEARLLHKNGIMSDNEFQQAKDDLRNARISKVEARENMRSVKAKADEQELKIARFKLENARQKYERIKRKLDKSKVEAPVTGVVLHPKVGKDSDYSLEEGSSFSEGDILLTVGNMQGLSVSSEVDEVDVQKLEEGQKVQVQGEGFSDITFEGVVDHVSTVSKDSSGSDLTVFPVRVEISELNPENRKKIRLGMTANMQAQVYSNTKAKLVPLDAVVSSGEKHFVRVKDEKTGKVKRVEVEPGITTMSMVEIRNGLDAEDKVVVP